MPTVDYNGTDWKDDRALVIKYRPPLPYRIAKSLDPEIHRNVEFDIWQEAQKELSQFDVTLSPALCLGDKCLVRLGEDPEKLYHAHIQHIGHPDDPAVVFVEELGEKHQVPFSSLQPLLIPQYSYNDYYSRKKNRKGYRMIPCGPAFSPTSPQNCAIGRGRGAWTGGQRLPSPRIPGMSCKPRIMIDSAGHPVRPKWQTQDKSPSPHSSSTSPAPADSPPEQDYASNNDQFSSSSPEVGSEAYPYPCEASYPSPGYTKPNDGYIPTPVSQITCPPPPPSHQMYAQSSVPQVLPFYPCIAVPHMEDVQGYVNFGCGQSQDPAGNDLPLNEPATLRFFFNLGYEYYRIVTYLYNQQQHQQIGQYNGMVNGPPNMNTALPSMNTALPHAAASQVTQAPNVVYYMTQPQPQYMSQQPMMHASQPIMNASPHMMNSTQPMMNSSQPMINSSQPLMQMNSSQPMMNSSQPIMQASQPMMNSSQTMMNSSQQMLNSSQPMIQSSQQMINSPQPLMQSSQPLMQPSQTMVQSSQPIVQASLPVVQPTPPVVQPCPAAVPSYPAPPPHMPPPLVQVHAETTYVAPY